MLLKNLLNSVEYTLMDKGLLELDITGLSNNSKTIKKGEAYFSLQGNLDGDNYLDEARINASVTIGESPKNDVIVKDVRKQMAIMAANFYDNPQQKLKIVGVVGTNGKTTTTYLMYKMLSVMGYSCSLVGTEGIYIKDTLIDTDLTTPDPIRLFELMKQMTDVGVQYTFIEVSAHAIFYKKLYPIRHSVLVFTNITQDHLDFFKTLEAYQQVKTSYFCKENAEIAVINADDVYGRKIIYSGKMPIISYGISNPSDVFAINVESNKEIRFVLNAIDQIENVSSKLVGGFNVYNIMAAISALCCLGFKSSKLVDALREIPPPKGRYEGIISSRARVIIDYAHTPDALQNILSDIARNSKGRIITVFGCGGNRDKEKRPKMGEVASIYSDIIILTSDNSRTEPPSQIISEIKRGVKRGKVYVEEDRILAIKLAFSIAKSRDTILIAGKGNEDYMDVNGQKIPYSDRQTVLSIIEGK